MDLITRLVLASPSFGFSYLIVWGDSSPAYHPSVSWSRLFYSLATADYRDHFSGICLDIEIRILLETVFFCVLHCSHSLIHSDLNTLHLSRARFLYSKTIRKMHPSKSTNKTKASPYACIEKQHNIHYLPRFKTTNQNTVWETVFQKITRIVYGKKQNQVQQDSHQFSPIFPRKWHRWKGNKIWNVNHPPQWHSTTFSARRRGRVCRLMRLWCFFIQFLSWKCFGMMRTEPKRLNVNGVWNICAHPWNFFILTSIEGLKHWKEIRPLTAPGCGSPSIITTLQV